MSILQTSPASLRAGPPVIHQHRGSLTPQSRPYLVTGSKRTSSISISTQQCLSLFPHEPEDARLTGCTRSLYRRLLALNLPGSLTRIQAHSETNIFSAIDSKIA
ncbi:MAG TPA: hypothetical protein VFE22_14690 [Edaphobacter sp.]|mgnify:CR=1 FL=1|nr:hypothetical protein [Edaphobacter sp.]